jgi:hypothetical protein
MHLVEALKVPALVVSAKLQRQFAVDHTTNDTTSILASMEMRWHPHQLSSREPRRIAALTCLRHREQRATASLDRAPTS